MLKVKNTIIICLVFYVAATAQMGNILEVVSVEITGQGNMTPTARWFSLNPNGEIQGGNGRLVHTRGYFKKEGESLFILDENNQPDPYGAFRMSSNQDTLQWDRKEEGMNVTVKLVPRNAIPLAPWDHLIGVWRNIDDESQQIHFHWDREFTLHGNWLVNSTGRGIWHIPGHRSELRLIAFDESAKQKVFDFNFIHPNQLLLECGEHKYKLIK